MSLQGNTTNYFGCLINDDTKYFCVNTAFQGYTSIFFGLLDIIYMGFFGFLLKKLLKISKTSFTYKMIVLTTLILLTLAIFAYLDFDFSLFCLSGLFVDFTFPSYMITTIISIFLFDYIICKALILPDSEVDNIQSELEHRIELIFKLIYITSFDNIYKFGFAFFYAFYFKGKYSKLFLLCKYFIFSILLICILLFFNE